MTKKCVPYTIRIGELEETSVVPVELEEELAILCSERGRSFLAIFEKGLAAVKEIESGGGPRAREVEVKRVGIDPVRSRELNAIALGKWEAAGCKMWRLPPDVWDCVYILRTGTGIHTVYQGMGKTQARAWLRVHGIEDTYESKE